MYPSVTISARHMAAQMAGNGPGHNHCEGHVEQQDKNGLALGPGEITPPVPLAVDGWLHVHSLAILL